MDNANTANNQVYSVVILRRDNQHIVVLETQNYDEAYELWKDVKNKWIKASKDLVAFELEKPIVTAFDPGLICEIKIAPIALGKNNYNNPYTQDMIKNGFTKSFGNFTGGGEVLDGGFR